MNWQDGDDVIIVPSLSDADGARRRFPAGVEDVEAVSACGLAATAAALAPCPAAVPRRGSVRADDPRGGSAMIFRQLYDLTSGTYTYLMASRRGGEALIVDPVLDKVDRYLQLMRELDLRLVKAVDTHLHADHITGLGFAPLAQAAHCVHPQEACCAIPTHLHRSKISRGRVF